MSNDLSVNMRLAENRRRDDERRRAAATFVPSTETIRSEYGNSSAASRATFDRWLAEHDREVRAEAIRSLVSRVDTARAWLEALGDPVALMRKCHAILSEIAPDATPKPDDAVPGSA